MATAAFIPVSEYLSSSYEVDCDYVDGELQERNVGEWEHGYLQLLLGRIFGNNADEWQVDAATEVRVQVGPGRYRVPDLCVIRMSEPAHGVLVRAPLICIEVLSPEDRYYRVRERLADYHRMGVKHVWVFDPITFDAWIAKPDGSQLHVSDVLVIPETSIRIDVQEVWDVMKKKRART